MKARARPQVTAKALPPRVGSGTGSDHRGGNGAIIEARGVVKVYESGRLRVEALRGIDLTVRAGEMLAVVGPSGCGKTTLLNCLSGLDDVTAGQAMLEGRDVAAMDDLERTRLRSRRMGFIFQSFNLLPVLSARENVELPLLVSGVPPRESARRAQAALAQVGLAGLAEHKPRELSGGQQQRVTVARSLVNEPAIVWADEPTGNLDTKHGQEVLWLLHDLNQRKGLTFVIVTHDPVIAQSCHRIVHMEDGRIRTETKGAGRALPLADSRKV